MKNVIIGILATLVVILGGYVVYDKFISKDANNSNNSTSNKEVVEKDFNRYEAEGLIEKYLYKTFDELLMSNVFLGKPINMDKYKLYSAIEHAQTTKINYLCIKAFPEYFSGDKVNGLIQDGDFVGGCYDFEIAPDYYRQYKYEDVDKTYKELFGNDSNAPKTNIRVSSEVFAYSQKYDAYIQMSCECGGSISGTVGDIFGIKSAKIIDDKLVIDIGYGTYYIQDMANEGILNTTNGEIKITRSEIDSSKSLVGKYLDKLDTYEFEFFKEDETYKLKNITKK